MEGIFFVKKVGDITRVAKANGDVFNKRNIVITARVCRMGDGGLYTQDQDFAIDLKGDRADTFDLKENTWIAANLSFSTYEYNGAFYPEIRLVRYCEI